MRNPGPIDNLGRTEVFARRLSVNASAPVVGQYRQSHARQQRSGVDLLRDITVEPPSHRRNCQSVSGKALCKRNGLHAGHLRGARSEMKQGDVVSEDILVTKAPVTRMDHRPVDVDLGSFAPTDIADPDLHRQRAFLDGVRLDAMRRSQHPLRRDQRPAAGMSRLPGLAELAAVELGQQAWRRVVAAKPHFDGERHVVGSDAITAHRCGKMENHPQRPVDRLELIELQVNRNLFLLACRIVRLAVTPHLFEPRQHGRFVAGVDHLHFAARVDLQRDRVHVDHAHVARGAEPFDAAIDKPAKPRLNAVLDSCLSHCGKRGRLAQLALDKGLLRRRVGGPAVMRLPCVPRGQCGMVARVVYLLIVPLIDPQRDRIDIDDPPALAIAFAITIHAALPPGPDRASGSLDHRGQHRIGSIGRASGRSGGRRWRGAGVRLRARCRRREREPGKHADRDQEMACTLPHRVASLNQRPELMRVFPGRHHRSCGWGTSIAPLANACTATARNRFPLCHAMF